MSATTITTTRSGITKADVPAIATTAGLIGLFVFLAILFTAGMVHCKVYPGFVEICLGAACGIPIGLFTAWRQIVLLTRAAIARKRQGDPNPLWEPLDPDWGWGILGRALVLVIFAAAFAVDYWLWKAAPNMAMPWSRFAYAKGYGFACGAAAATDPGFPFESMAALGMSAWLFGHLAATICLMRWYASLPPHSSPQGAAGKTTD